MNLTEIKFKENDEDKNKINLEISLEFKNNYVEIRITTKNFIEEKIYSTENAEINENGIKKLTISDLFDKDYRKGLYIDGRYLNEIYFDVVQIYILPLFRPKLNFIPINPIINNNGDDQLIKLEWNLNLEENGIKKNFIGFKEIQSLLKISDFSELINNFSFPSIKPLFDDEYYKFQIYPKETEIITGNNEVQYVLDTNEKIKEIYIPTELQLKSEKYILQNYLLPRQKKTISKNKLFKDLKECTQKWFLIRQNNYYFMNEDGKTEKIN